MENLSRGALITILLVLAALDTVIPLPITGIVLILAFANVGIAREFVRQLLDSGNDDTGDGGAKTDIHGSDYNQGDN